MEFDGEVIRLLCIEVSSRIGVRHHRYEIGEIEGGGGGQDPRIFDCQETSSPWGSSASSLRFSFAVTH